MNQKIPIYRAKKIGSDEWVVGYYQTETGTNVEDKNNMFRTLRHIIIDLDKHQLRLDLFGDKKLHNDSHIREQYEIDPTTLSIHFPDMLDSQGNKIFASLREDGKGGDILFDMEYEFTLIFDDLKFKLEGLYSNTEINEYDKFTNFDSIGVQE